MSNRAWITLATNDSYGLGALVLANSIRRTGSAYPAVILVTPAVTDAMRERLNGVFAEVITVDVLDSRDEAHLALLQRPELGITFTKIHCWSLTQYEKCVFLDADTLVIQNSDDLFEREELSAAPDIGWPDCFNSGVFVFTPSKDTFDALIRFAQERGSFDGGDQGLLNSFFSDWARGDLNKHLPFLYNVTSAAFYSYLPAFKQFGQDMKIIHFIGASKPWLQHYNWESGTVDASDHLRDVLQLWWSIFVSSVHSQLDTAMVEEAIAQEQLDPELPEEPAQPQYYEPPPNQDSEFPWHHARTQDSQEEESQKLDLTQFHNPWHYYRGDIPLKTDQLLKTSHDQANPEMTQELRDYIWEYKEKYSDNTYNYQPPSHNQGNYQWENHHVEQHYNVQVSHYHSGDSNYQAKSSHSDHDQHWDQYLGSSDQQWDHQPGTFNQNDFHSHNQQNQDQNYHQPDHNNHYHNNSTPQVKTHDQFNEIHNHDSHNSHSLKGHEHIVNIVQVEPSKLLHQHNENDRTHGPEEVQMNGDISDSEEEEEVRPRHPYDGFYLRHRITIDPRGRKICTHELPPTPPPSPPPPIHPLVPPVEVHVVETHESGDKCTGVAGNLARVVPGAPSTQRDAIDDLSRRQGWEAGNIDYMGADSFDNIWAKISQTLNQSTPKQRTPPKEPSPPKIVEKTCVVSDEVSKEQSIETQLSPIEATAPVPKEKPVLEAKPEEIAKDQVVKSYAPSLDANSVPQVSVIEDKSKEQIPLPPDSASAAFEEQQVKLDEPNLEAPEIKESKSKEEPVVELTPTAAVESKTPQVAESIGNLEPKVKEAIGKPIAAPDSPAVKQPVVEPSQPQTPVSPAVALEAPSSPATPIESKPPQPLEALATPEKALDLTLTATESPPLANTPSKEELTLSTENAETLTSSTEKADGDRRKRVAGKLQLYPPAATVDALPTPDSELEDAASLAQSIIAGELASPTVTAATPAADAPITKPSLVSTHSLSIDAPTLETPPAGPVSCPEHGVKPKPTIAAQIESSLSETASDTPDKVNSKSHSTPEAAAEPIKKKIVKKVKKTPTVAAGGEAPVPPPRKKEKKPKEN